ncbi:MAG TPA: VOC family protein [Solirubrobacter sp.]|nr:VOC family protein [Solirubrobacter sp.]
MTIRRAIPTLYTEDLGSAREFYERFLGFEVAMDEPDLMLFRSPSNPTAQVIAGSQRGLDQARVSVEVADVDAVYEEAVRRNLEIVYPLTDEPWHVRRFFVRDPSGVVVNVASHN